MKKPSHLKKGKLILVHWNDAEWRELAAPLQAQGWQVVPMAGATGLKLKNPPENRPAAVLISLRRLPSHGHEVAEAVWNAAIPVWVQWGRRGRGLCTKGQAWGRNVQARLSSGRYAGQCRRVS